MSLPTKLALSGAYGQVPTRIDKRFRLGAWAFLTSIFIQGLPIGREIAGQTSMAAEDRFQVAVNSATTIGLENTWLAALLWGAIYFASMLVIIRFRQRSFLHSLRKLWPLTLLLALVPVSMIWVGNPLPVLMNAIHGIGITAVAFAASVAYYDRLDLFLRHMMMAFGFNLAVQVVAVFTLSGATDYAGRWIGLTTNANTLGLISAVALWVSGMAWFIRSAPRPRILMFIFLAIVPLIGSGSITSILVVLIALSLSIVVLKTGGLVRYATFLALLSAPLLVLIAESLFTLFAIHIAPILGKSSNLSGRIELWGQGWGIALQRPILGWGFDHHATVIRELHLPTVHFHNGYIDLLTRGGVLALVLFIIFVLMMINRAVIQSPIPRMMAVSFAVFFLIYNVSEVSIMQFRNVSWLVFITLAFVIIPRREGMIR